MTGPVGQSCGMCMKTIESDSGVSVSAGKKDAPLKPLCRPCADKWIKGTKPGKRYRTQ